MIDTNEPPKRPPSSRPRPSGRSDRQERGGERTRDAKRRDPEAKTRDAKRRDPEAKTRGAEPAPARDDARIAKVMARAGLCSRRDAEAWIAAGRVAVNGVVIDSPALNVGSGDRITVDGEALPERERTRLFLFHKPRGLVTTARDPEGRPTIFDSLPGALPRVVSVGRLDINTEGLMLLTNDGGLARVLELPATGWLRRYRVRANGAIDQSRLDGLKAGVTLDGVDYAGIEATLDRIQGANVWLTMGLREGKNREIKRVLESLGLAVTRLIRVSFGPFQLGELAEGAVEAVPNRVLRDQLGPGLAAAANVDLDGGDETGGRPSARHDDTVAPPRPSRAEPGAPRPHVAAMRAARAEAAAEGRTRIERGATADRRGRAVKVERVISVGTGPERGGESRNARRFAAEKDGFVAGRQKTRAESRDARNGSGPTARTRPDDGTRPAHGGPRRDGRGGFGKDGGDERKPRPGARPSGSRVDRAADDRPRSGKPNGRPGGFGSERPVTGRNKTGGARSAPGGFKPDRPSGGDGPKSGGRPRGGTPPGDRPPRRRP